MTDNSDDNIKETELRHPKLKFRNYQPFDADLKRYIVKRENETSEANSSINNMETDVIRRELALLSTNDINVVPKKINHDLKSQVESRLEKLRKRTQRAIVEIIREKISQNGNNAEWETN